MSGSLDLVDLANTPNRVRECPDNLSVILSSFLENYNQKEGEKPELADPSEDPPNRL
jgi:hypothetical protein